MMMHQWKASTGTVLQAVSRMKGRLAIFVNNRWCKPAQIKIKERICCPNIEPCAVGLRPYYLHREFTHVILVTVYSPPSGNLTAACDTMHSAIAQLQTQHPSGFISILGDFNHVLLDTTLPTFTQYVVYPTKGERICCMLWMHTVPPTSHHWVGQIRRP